MSNPNPTRGSRPKLIGLAESRNMPDLPARVIDAAGRSGQFSGNQVRLDTGEIVEPDGFIVVWPGV